MVQSGVQAAPELIGDPIIDPNEVGEAERLIENGVEFIKLYEYKKVDEYSGISIRPKAYQYWVNTLANVMFKRATGQVVLEDGRMVQQNRLTRDFTRVRSNNIYLRISITGYAPATNIMYKSYNFSDIRIDEYPWLPYARAGIQFLALLNQITKQNYRIQKYKEKIAKRQKYGIVNQNTKMLNTVYNRFGDDSNSKRRGNANL